MTVGTTSQAPQTYDRVARLLHWLVVALIAAQFLIGWIMPDIGRDTQQAGLVAWHLSVGAALIAAVVARIAWRLTHRAPPSTSSPALGAVSRATHFLLYVFLVLVPLLGWANASSRGWHVKLLGAIDLPSLAPTGSPTGHAMGDIHSALAWVLLALIGVHVGAALFHRFVLKDNVMQRMMP